MTDGERTARAAYTRLIERAWTDPAFKDKLMSDPASTLSAAGISVPSGLKVKVVEDTDQLVHFVLPRSRPQAAISDRDLEQILCSPILSSVKGFCDIDC